MAKYSLLIYSSCKNIVDKAWKYFGVLDEINDGKKSTPADFF